MPAVLPDEDSPEAPLAGIPTSVSVRIRVGNQFIAELTIDRPSDLEAQSFGQQWAPEIDALLHKERLAH